MSDAAGAAVGAKANRGGVSAWLPALLQLAVAAMVVYLYRIENDAFFRIFLLATVGFAINAVLPLAYRLPFFTLLSIGGAFIVFNPADALWLLASGSVLIGLANLPIGMTSRVLLLVSVGAVLAVSRAGVVSAPWSAGVWPILSSMFMFRLVLYVMASKADPPKQRPWWSLAYFFMLPNLVFPLFPVVDYQTFRRTYYDKEEAGIYNLGVLWIGRGLIHLLLYRYIYQDLIGDAESIVTLGDLAQFMLATLLLYLRVSGQFHLIVGMLHLFGFRLPETHKLYLLAFSFTELWRRINIYWTDFMMKSVFYPTYFRVKGRGPKAALVISTIVVFVTTWLLHSYQWFWLRGGFPLTPQDTAFWSILGAFVVFGGLRELNAVKKPRRLAGDVGWNPKRGLQTAITFTIFSLLWSLWSTESLNLWLWLLGSAANIDAKGIVIVTATLAIVFALGSREWKGGAVRSGWLAVVLNPNVRTSAALLLLCVLAQSAVTAAVPPQIAEVLRSMSTSGLNARDLSVQHRGYYEQLDVRAQLDAPVGAGGQARTAPWQTLDQLGVLEDRQDLMLRDLRPSRAVTWNGHSFSTNRWGMRDRDYDRDKPSNTLRIAILGPSHVMGNNVEDGAAFESVVEDRLNRDFTHAAYRHFEILNFGVDGYSLPQQLALLEQRVLGFEPDVIIASHYKDNREMTQGFLLRVGEQGLPTRDPVLEQMLTRAGLRDMGTGGLPVPYAIVRRGAGHLGIETRMPYGEARSRAKRMANEVLVHSFARFAELTRSRGIAAAVLALNVVVDDLPEIPLRGAIDRAGLPLFDLFGVYATADRAALRVAPWDDHPNAEGHRLIAERFYDDLTAFIRSGAIERAQKSRTVD